MRALDTNALNYFFKGQGRGAVRLLATAPAEIATPEIVVYEIETGITKSAEPARRRAQFDALLGLVTTLPFDQAAASHAAAIRAALERAGQPIGPIDTLIVGTALANGATLITRNLRELSRIPHLQVIDWYG